MAIKYVDLYFNTTSVERNEPEKNFNSIVGTLAIVAGTLTIVVVIINILYKLYQKYKKHPESDPTDYVADIEVGNLPSLVEPVFLTDSRETETKVLAEIPQPIEVFQIDDVSSLYSDIDLGNDDGPRDYD